MVLDRPTDFRRRPRWRRYNEAVTVEISPDRPTENRAARDLRFNFAACVGDSVGWPLGMAFFSTSTVLEAFLLRLHATYFLVGALPAVISLGYFLPGVVVSRRIRTFSRYRPWLFWVGICERIPLLAIPAIVIWLGASHATLLMTLFFVLFAVHAVMLGINQPSYWALVAKLIPTDLRGRMFGIAGVIGGLLGFFVDPLTHYFLRTFGQTDLRGYAACFLLGAVIVTVSFLPFGVVREVRVEPDIAPSDLHEGHYLRDSVAVLRADGHLRLLLFSAVPFAFCAAAPTYFLAASLVRFHPGAAEIALYTTILCVASAIGNLVWGWWADRRGNKVVLVVATVITVCGVAVAIHSGSPLGFAWAFALSALGAAGVALVTFNIVLEFAPGSGDIPLYMAVYNGCSGPFKALAPLFYGWLADRAGFSPVFISATVLGAISLGLAASVQEPRRAQGAH